MCKARADLVGRQKGWDGRKRASILSILFCKASGAYIIPLVPSLFRRYDLHGSSWEGQEGKEVEREEEEGIFSGLLFPKLLEIFVFGEV